ncbi:MAG: D-alanine--poly(phosphoribitol) ligase [Desulfobacterium sp.]|nr:D-alanine--poly(phosphoribitol) ligase [Desulfobacterium sp.]
MVNLLQHLLIKSAKQYPDKNAIVYHDEKITYKDLDLVTSKLAATLLENGVQRGDRIGVYINKSIPSIISILGILKACGVYVPLDPNAPLKRLAYIIENAGMKCLLTSTRKGDNVQQMFPEKNPLDMVLLTDDFKKLEADLSVKVIPWEEILKRGDASFPDNLSIETDLAYILYTSGSTGTPKGVMISHYTSLSFINWSYHEFEIRPEDRVSSHAPLHFDLSIFDIFTSLQAGATIFLVPEEYSIFPRRLIKFIQDNKITVWYSVPSILMHMMVHGNMKNNSFLDLRLILFAGEVFPVKYLRELMSIIPHAGYYNLYGPTETNVCTYYKVDQLEPERIKPVPIGKACSNTDVFALDGNKNIVTEVGKEGELYVRGSCVAQGYWCDLEKTESYFIKNFLNPEFDEKLYRTGDIVTLDEKGNYNLIGRKDHMIKSRGYRIELGEIEAALYAHQGVKEAVAVAVPDEFITNKIKAFVVPKNSDSLTKIEIEKHLSELIPHYMMPEMIEFCKSLPKTSTGKIDRKAMTTN